MEGCKSDSNQPVKLVTSWINEMLQDW